MPIVTNSEWTKPPVGGRVGNSVRLTGTRDLKDVEDIEPSDGDVLVYDSAASLFKPGSAGSTLTDDGVNAIAAGNTLGLEQKLLAQAGQPAKTVLAVGYTNTGKVQGVSLGNGNVIEVFASGADFNLNTVLYREFMSLGEPICFTGLANGAIITSTQGFYGFSEQVNGGDESPMPLLSFGLSFKETFMYAFRNSQTYRGGASSGSGAEGWVHVVNGPVASKVSFLDGNNNVVRSQSEIDVPPWGYLRLYTEGNKEYIIRSTNPVMACHNAEMDTDSPRFYDSRLIMPLSNDLISWPRSGRFSTPYQNVLTKWYSRDNESGEFTTSSGSPFNMGGLPPNDADYEPNGATRTLINGLGTWYSGADSSGLEASPAMPVSGMSQLVAQPLFIEDSGDGGNSGVAIASTSVGTAFVYEWDDVSGKAVLAYIVPLNRSGVTVDSPDKQFHPTAGLVANETVEGAVALTGNLRPGYVLADVPITVIVQNSNPSYKPDLRSQNGTTTSSIISDDDETLSLGWTPENLKAEIRQDTGGYLRKRVISGIDGSETWVMA